MLLTDGLKKSLLHFQYLLKYSTFTVLMDHNALKSIYCSRHPHKTVRIQKFLEEFQTFFQFSTHIWQIYVCSDFLSRFSSANKNEEPIPFLTKNSSLDTSSYMTKIDDLCQYDYVTNMGICLHSFPLTRSQSKLQQVAIPNLFQPDTSRPAHKASILRDPPAVMAGKRLTTVPSIVPPEPAPAKRGRGHPRKVRTLTTTATIQEPNVEQDLDLNDTLPTLYLIKRKLRQPTPVPLPVIGHPPTPLYNEDETALKNIHE